MCQCVYLTAREYCAFFLPLAARSARPRTIGVETESARTSRCVSVCYLAGPHARAPRHQVLSRRYRYRAPRGFFLTYGFTAYCTVVTKFRLSLVTRVTGARNQTQFFLSSNGYLCFFTNKEVFNRTTTRKRGVCIGALISDWGRPAAPEQRSSH